MLQTLNMKYTILLLFLFFQFLELRSQDIDPNIRFEDYVYLDNIKSVTLTTGNLIMGYPIILLNSNARLVLSFDDLDDEGKNYIYTIIHCDYDWKPSTGISDIDYIEGFNEDDIDNYDFSFNTTINYANYQLVLPNEELAWTISGNFLLAVYDDSDERQLAITRRFMVVDPKVNINPQFRYPANVSKSRTHQEIDFRIDHENFPIRNPRTDIKVVVMQNGRWDTAIKDIDPLFVKPNELIYDYQDKITFPAGKEFRAADIRTFEYNTVSMAEVVESRDRFDITLNYDRSRAELGYTSFDDINGKFLIESFEEDDANLRSEYGYVLFTLKESPPFQNHDVYLLGAFTDWRIDDRYKLVYNELISAYVVKLLLKQGFYNYAYAVVERSPSGKKEDTIQEREDLLAELEGNWYEAENDYTILVYYRPFGARYDQLIGARTVGTGR